MAVVLQLKDQESASVTPREFLEILREQIDKELIEDWSYSSQGGGFNVYYLGEGYMGSKKKSGYTDARLELWRVENPLIFCYKYPDPNKQYPSYDTANQQFMKVLSKHFAHLIDKIEFRDYRNSSRED